MNLLPLCTANVCPTNSGGIVERRAHVFTTRLSPLLFMSCTLPNSLVSTNGPFLSERAIGPVLSLRPPAHDVLVRRLRAPRAIALGRLAPRRDRVPAAGRL